MFNGGYFSVSYFAERYFPKHGDHSAEKNNGYFPHNYFGKRYFPNEYFPGSEKGIVPPPLSRGGLEYINIFRKRRR